MRGRPKKIIEEKLIQELAKNGMSNRQIGNHLKISKDTVRRILRHWRKNGAKIEITSKAIIADTQENPGVAQKSESGAKIPHVEEWKVVETTGAKIPQAKPPATTDPPPTKLVSSELPQPAYGIGHKLGFLANYSGKQPLNSEVWYLGKNKIPKSTFVWDGSTIQTSPKTIIIWINDGVKGSSIQEIKDRAKGRARARLGRFAEQYGITIDLDNLKPFTEPDINLPPGEFDEEFKRVLEEKLGEAKKEGMLPGDGSHNETELLKETVKEKDLNGHKHFESLMWILNELPKNLEDRDVTFEKKLSELETRTEQIAETLFKLEVKKEKDLANISEKLNKLSENSTSFESQSNQNMAWIGETLKSFAEIIGHNKTTKKTREN